MTLERAPIDLTRRPELVAPELLGWTIACRGTAAVIVEVEAYHQDEPASHSFGGRPTPRTQAMFGPPGHLYVYFTYGMHWCANIVTGPEGSGAAVLLRGVVPLAGEHTMRERRAAPRGGDPARWSTREIGGGPARLTQALAIQSADNGIDLFRCAALDFHDALRFAGDDGPVLVYDPAAAAKVGIDMPVTDDALLIGPRIGITKAVDLPWRFGVASAGLSRVFPA